MRRLAEGDPTDVRQRIDALLMAPDEAFFHADHADRSLLWSAGAALALGNSHDALGSSIDDLCSLVHPDDRAHLLSGLGGIDRRVPAWTGRVRLARGDGRFRAARVRVVTVRRRDGGAEIVGAVAFEPDSERHEGLVHEVAALRARLAEAERRHDLVCRAVTDSVYEWDATTGVLFHAGGIQRLLGYHDMPVESGDRWWLDRVHPDDRAAVAASFGAFVSGRTDERWEATYRFRKADGSYVTLVDRAHAIRTRDGTALRVVGSASLARDDDARRRTVRLTSRQAEVLDLVRAGDSNRRIGERLGISQQGVKEHVSNLFRKFDVPNRAALVAVAAASRIVREDRGS